MTRIVIRVKGEEQAMKRLADIEARLRNPKGGLIRATNKVAEKFGENFDGEGSLVGGWPDLAEQTRNIREWQGFPAEHPILFRYGALRAIAVEFFEEAKRGGSRSKGDNYSNEVVTGRLDINGNVAQMWVGGSYKVMNHYGHPNVAPEGDNPPRPFWFVNRYSVAAAREGVKDWIEDEVLKG